MYIMDHVNCIRIKSAGQFIQILEEVMKGEKAARSHQKRKYKEMVTLEPFHPVTWKCSSSSSSSSNNNDDDSGRGYEGVREER